MERINEKLIKGDLIFNEDEVTSSVFSLHQGKGSEENVESNLKKDVEVKKNLEDLSLKV